MKRVIIYFLLTSVVVACSFFLYSSYCKKKTGNIAVLYPETTGPYKQHIAGSKNSYIDHEIYKNKKDSKYTVVLEKHHIFTNNHKNSGNNNLNKIYKSNIPVVTHEAIRPKKSKKEAVYIALLDTVQDPIDAEKTWRELQDNNPVLKKYPNYQLHKVTKNGQVFYYIAINNFSKESEAKLLCKKLQCIVKKIYISR